MTANLNHEINLALRTAAGHMRAAHEAETAGNRQYEMKMKSAGASMYGAFKLALTQAPEYQGRRIDDKAIRRIYESNKPRPWWDAHLAKVKFEGQALTRETATRAIQWHLDPEAAASRRASRSLADANRMKQLRKSASRGPVGPRRSETVDVSMTKFSERITAASVETALAGRELPQIESRAAGPSLDDLLAEMLRIRSAVQKVKPEDIEAVLDILRTTAREVESYVE